MRLPRIEEIAKREIVHDANWQLGLGMHNFRAAERKYSVQSIGPILLRGIRSRVRRSRVSVKKSKRSRRLSRKSKPAAMQLGRRGRDKKGKSVSKLKKVKWYNQRRRERRLFVLKLVYEKRVPLSFRMHCLNGFSVFRKCVRVSGLCKAVGLHLHWRTSECKRVQGILVEIRRKLELENALKAEAKGVLRWGSNTGPRPQRSSYTSFNKWKDGIELWQISRCLCRSCYKIVSEDPRIGTDGRYWKGDDKFRMKYDKDICFRCNTV